MRSIKRAKRVRYKLRSSSDRTRLSVFKSINHISVQAIDDIKGETIASATTNCKAFDLTKASRTQKAEWVGKQIAAKLQEKKVKAVCLDRGSYAYHGVIKALADAARAGGLDF